jgi:hypothetical protein
MNGVGESQVYTCQCKGCISGRSFSAHVESWWYARNMVPPRNCPSCREWMEAQVDDSAICTICSWKIPISGKRKRYFHKREGVWRNPDLCSRCEEDPAAAQRVAAAKSRTRIRTRPLEPNERQAEGLIRFLSTQRKYPGSPHPIAVSDDPSWWLSTTREYRLQGVQSIWEHVVPRHGDEIQGAAQLRGEDELLPYISKLAASGDGSKVVQFTQGNRVVKLDIMTSVVLIIDPIRGVPVTSFVVEDNNIVNKLRNGIWS